MARGFSFSTVSSSGRFNRDIEYTGSWVIYTAVLGVEPLSGEYHFVIFYFHVTVHRNKFLCNKTNYMHQFLQIYFFTRHVEFRDKINLSILVHIVWFYYTEIILSFR